MKNYSKITPEGTRDLLFEECKARNAVTGKLTKLFSLRGYRQVMTPALEFYDVFHGSACFGQESMRKLIDNKGRLLVMRPDCTIPIARLTATRLKTMPMPLRLYYCQSVYNASPDMKGKSNEIYQAGVELIGTDSYRSDLEIIELAAAGLDSFYTVKYRLELCHIGYFKAIIDSLQTDEQTKEVIRTHIEQKNYAALTDVLAQFGGCEAAVALKYLPRLYGGEEVFQRAIELFSANGAGEALESLRSIYLNLQKLGLEGKVMIDLGLVNQAEYYTGVIFRGYIEGIGEPVLSGGRYDNLISEFGELLPATGFGVNVDLIAKTMTGESVRVSPPDVLVFSAPDKLTDALSYITRLTQDGLIAENCVFDVLQEARDYARIRGIQQIHIVKDDITVEQMDREVRDR